MFSNSIDEKNSSNSIKLSVRITFSIPDGVRRLGNSIEGDTEVPS